MSDAPLLMIPGPVEISDAVAAAASGKPPGHLSAGLAEAFGGALASMRRVFCAAPSAQPFVVAGSGTLAMDMAAWNLVQEGDRVLVVHTGYFSARAAEVFRRAGAEVLVVEAGVGDAPSVEEVRAAFEQAGEVKALVLTHVDTSTGVLLGVEPYARLGRELGALVVVDGVCSVAGERLEMASWGVDVALTASQKALGVPPGLALLVASEAALAARRALRRAPPLFADFEQWQPIMRSYEDKKPRYFATPATSLVLALAAGLAEIEADRLDDGSAGIEARVRRHARVATALRRGFSRLGLSGLPASALEANTMSALLYPEGTGPSLVPSIVKHGVVVAGGLLEGHKDRYFRVGHMGYATTRPEMLERTLRAIARALAEAGLKVDEEAAVSDFRAGLELR